MQDITSEFADVLDGAPSDDSDDDDGTAPPPAKQPTPAFGFNAPPAVTGEQQKSTLLLPTQAHLASVGSR